MTQMIHNDKIQAALLARAKSFATILAKLSDTDEIREDQWQGREYSYPAYRIRIIRNEPSNDCYQRVEFSFQTFSENSSSQQADDMCGTINDEFHDKSFSRNSIRFTGVICSNLSPAMRVDKRTWRAEAFFETIISPAP
jgi:hypothetical protein